MSWASEWAVGGVVGRVKEGEASAQRMATVAWFEEASRPCV